MSYLAPIFGILAAPTGLAAAFFAYKAATSQREPAWECDPECRPKNREQETLGLAHAIEAVLFWSGRSSATAAILAAIAVLFTVLSAVFGFLD